MGKIACLAIGLVLGTMGCGQDSGTGSDAERLTQKCESLKRKSDDLQQSLDKLRAEKGAQDRQISGLTSENNSLKRQLASQTAALKARVADLEAQIASRAKAASSAAKAPAAAAPPAAAAAPAPDERADQQQNAAAIEETKRAISGLQDQIADLQTRINLARNEALDVAKATVDVPIAPPAGMFVRDGQLYRFEKYNAGTVKKPNWQNREVLVGPGVKPGDFRSQRDKDTAAAGAKAKIAAMQDEMQSLKNKLAELNEKLRKLTTP
jgi:chromosome segregation ATPase